MALISYEKNKIETYKVVSAEHIDFYYKYINQISGSATVDVLVLELPESYSAEFYQHINNIEAIVEFLDTSLYIKNSVVIRNQNCYIYLPDDFVLGASDGDVLVHLSYDVEQWQLKSVEIGTNN